MNKIPNEVREVLDVLSARGHEAFLVGGCVRDFLRGEAPHDYDVTTSALPEETLTAFDGYRTLTVGMKHGTVTVLVRGVPVEVTTYRVDGEYTDHRRPDGVRFTASLTEDLARRDLTVNAMAYHPERGLVDPFGGQKDLTDGIIRAVGDPHKRFSEDALRILRTMRFAARFDFIVEENTAVAAKALAPDLDRIAAERVLSEITLLLRAPAAERILLEFSEILARVLPEAALTPALGKMPREDTVLRFAALLFDSGAEGARRALLRLKADTATVNAVTRVVRICETPPPTEHSDVCRLLRAHGEQALRRAILLYEGMGESAKATEAMMKRILENNDCYTLAMLAVNGENLAAVGISRGKRMGEVLEALYTAVITGEADNTREALLSLAERMK